MQEQSYKPQLFRVLISAALSRSKGAEALFVAINGDLLGVWLHCKMLALLSLS